MQANQCRGVTTKGLRCKIITRYDYCHYHIRQSRSNEVSLSPKFDSQRKGFIYIYTLSVLLNKNRVLKLKVRNVKDKSGKNIDEWQVLSQSSPYILVKVGMTSQTVEKRLKQWEEKCHHRLSCLCPNNEAAAYIKSSSSSMNRLISKFSKLKIGNKIYKSFQEGNDGFYCQTNLGLAETEIHSRLREKYGYGDVICSGCAKNNKHIKLENNTSAQKAHNIHVEWFYVPRKDLEFIFDIIDTTCLKYN